MSMTSLALVASQFAALAVLVLPWDAPGWHAIGWLPLVLAVALAGWTLAHNRIGNFGVMPEPRPRARLVTSGPYALVRHPMYLAALLFGAGMLAGWRGVAHLVAFAALALVLHRKALREEALLAKRFPEYDAYRARTKRIVPFLL